MIKLFRNWLSRRRAFRIERMQREMLQHHKFPQ